MTSATAVSSRDAEVHPFPPSTKPSGMSVAREIERMVGEGRLVAGQRLVEADLTEQFSASRSTIREALRLLSGEGIVEIIPNCGGRIRRIGRERLAEMLEVFAALFQAATAKLLSRPLTVAARKSLNLALGDILAATERNNASEQLQALLAYHFLISRICGNDYFSEALDRLHIGHFLMQAGFEGFLRKDVDVSTMYRKLNSCLLRRDAVGAYKVWKPEIDRLAEHLRNQ